MSDNEHWYLDNDPKPNLYGWVFKHMAMGAVYAALAFFGIIAVVLLIRALSFILPDDPYAALELGTRVASALA
jgi:hypothetical protein